MTHNPPIHYPVPPAFADLPYITKDVNIVSENELVTALHQSCNDLSGITAETNGVDHHDPISTLNLKVQLMNGCKKELTNILNIDCPDKNKIILDCDNGSLATDINNGIYDPVMVTLKTKNGDNTGVINKARYNFISGDPIQKLLDILKNNTNTKKLGEILQNDPLTKKGKKKIQEEEEEQKPQILPTPPPQSFY
ncbi:MAG: hypothetical protein ACTHKK_08255 [Candidatus Nitrosocosmicus sp.]